MEWTNRKTHRYEAVSSALNLPFLKDISQNCFVFWCFELRKLRKSRRIDSFLTLPSSNIEEISQNRCIFDVVNFKSWGSFAGLLEFQSLQIDRQTGRQLQLHYTTLLLQLQLEIHVQIHYATLNYPNYITLRWLQYTTLTTLHFTDDTTLH